MFILVLDEKILLTTGITIGNHIKPFVGRRMHAVPARSRAIRRLLIDFELSKVDILAGVAAGSSSDFVGSALDLGVGSRDMLHGQ